MQILEIEYILFFIMGMFTVFIPTVLFTKKSKISNWSRRLTKDLNIQWKEEGLEISQPIYSQIRKPTIDTSLSSQLDSKMSSFKIGLMKMIEIRIKYLQNAVSEFHNSTNSKLNLHNMRKEISQLRKQYMAIK
ncbi:MAG: hypothetical protein ACTSUV_06665 [Candidatus Ranarchaeia archaeon]